MNDQRWALLVFLVLLLLVLAIAGAVSAGATAQTSPSPPPGRAATQEELARAMAEWEQSAHAATYDEGMGANTTCARCKSPENWDPLAPAAEQALNCASCKRVPGAPRPALAAGEAVSENEWQHISCNICHIPVGDSFGVGLAFWNEAYQVYEPVTSETDLCTRCHEGRHGFEVVAEQERSLAHQGWACSRCHGAHGAAATCVTCHDPGRGDGAADHALHTEVNCTSCHDAGHLGIWQERNPESDHFGEYIPVRFAHTVTSWPSHNLQLEVKCERCHHPRGRQLAAIAPEVSCAACHVDGAVLFWCRNFPQDADPTQGYK